MQHFGIPYEKVVVGSATTTFTWSGIEFEVGSGYFPPKCLSAKSVKHKSDRTAFIRKLLSCRYNAQYDYSEYVYTNARKASTVLCYLHGRFQKTVDNHLRGQGCPSCARVQLSKTSCKTLEQFVVDAERVHGTRYSYKSSVYITSGKPLVITCRVHGDFNQSPDNHLAGQGCAKCSTISASRKLRLRGLGGWSKSDYCKLSPRSHLYVVELSDGVSMFYKIGIAKTLTRRFSALHRALGCTPELLFSIEDLSENIWDLEKHLHTLLADCRYNPKKVFVGHTECFLNLDINLIKETVQQFLKEK